MEGIPQSPLISYRCLIGSSAGVGSFPSGIIEVWLHPIVLQDRAAFPTSISDDPTGGGGQDTTRSPGVDLSAGQSDDLSTARQADFRGFRPF